MRSMLSFARRQKYVGRNVALDVEAPTKVKSSRPALDADQLRKVLAAANNPTVLSVKRGELSAEPAFGAAIAFLAMTGCRRGEALALRWADVDLAAGDATIRNSLQQTKAFGLKFKGTKEGNVNTIALGDVLLGILTQHHATQQRQRDALGAGYWGDDLVFARADGSPFIPWNFGAAFRDVVKRSGVRRIGLHGLRHTHASLLGKANVDIKVVSKRLGHSSIKVTADCYSHVFPSQDRDAASAFEALLARP